MSRRRWGEDFYTAQPRRSVEGGVVVAKPGGVTHPLAGELVAAALVETSSTILARGRTYARAGQVVAVQAGARGFTAQIQGSTARPYSVRLDRTTISGTDRVAANCTCPYGCDSGWCKHAAALAYVAAFLLDRDPGARLAWSGGPEDDASQGDADEPTAGGRPAVPGSIAGIAVHPASALNLDPDELAILRSPIPSRAAVALLADAEALVPHPWSDPPGMAFDGRPADPEDIADPLT